MALYVNGKQISGGGGGGNTNSVELTYAEYQALTPEQQLDGTEYFITDINGDGQDFQPICYSEEEREIGVWTDGKPLYEKTVFISTALSSGVWNNEVLGTVGSNISIVDFMGFIYGDTLGNGVIFPLNYFRTTSEFVTTTTNLDGDDLNILPTIPDVGTLYIKYIVIRYTKTTDQAGSGTWTPQGVPAHHYSNNEQVVGTWIDGSTLYEKTLNVGTISTSTTFAHGITNLDTIIDHSGFGKYAGTDKKVMGITASKGYGTIYWFDLISYDSTNLNFDRDPSLSSNFSDCYCTIRYTKSST